MFQRYGSLAFVLGALFVGILGGAYYNKYVPREDLAYYYALITQQEASTPDVEVAEEDWGKLRACKEMRGKLATKRTQDCIRSFYEDYTSAHGIKRAFSHLALVEKENSHFVEDCHYVSHGIGHAQLKLSNGDAGKAFAVMSEDSYFKNVSTCGNGYFHGVVEEYAKYTTDKDTLIPLLSSACKQSGTKFTIDCFHGMGHAAFVQLAYDTEGSLYVCDNVSKDPVKRYSCYMGVFMEMAQDFTTRDLVEVKNGIMKFVVCDSLAERYQSACYAQHSAFFENFNTTPEDLKKNIGYCRQIANDQNRMACVKFFAGKATRVHYGDIKGMCVDATSSRDERLMCAGVFATRIARALDSTHESPLYTQAIEDVCRNLPFYESAACIDLVMHKSGTIYLDPRVSGAML